MDLIHLAINKAQNPEMISLNSGMAANGIVCMHESNMDIGSKHTSSAKTDIQSISHLVRCRSICAVTWF
jgi:hypothetical protein